jgi:hypothetical protein
MERDEQPHVSQEMTLDTPVDIITPPVGAWRSVIEAAARRRQAEVGVTMRKAGAEAMREVEEAMREAEEEVMHEVKAEAMREADAETKRVRVPTSCSEEWHSDEMEDSKYSGEQTPLAGPRSRRRKARPGQKHCHRQGRWVDKGLVQGSNR